MNALGLVNNRLHCLAWTQVILEDISDIEDLDLISLDKEEQQQLDSIR